MKPHRPCSHRSQRGASLIVVMVMLLLGSILVVGSTRLGWYNEILVGSESDSQRAFAAAEALIRDAERDVRGLQIDNMTRCQPGAEYIGCRLFVAPNPYFPEDDNDLDELQLRVSGAGSVNSCFQGICLPAAENSLMNAWDSDANVDLMTPVGATYGQYTLAAPGAAGNPLLSANPPTGWYWVEVFRFSDAGGIVSPAGDNVPIPDKAHPFVYRITAHVRGLRDGTRVHLRSIFVPFPQNQNQ